MRKSSVVMAIVLAVGLSLVPAAPALAHSAHGNGAHPMFHKLGRGVSNAVTGWMEVPYQIGHGFKASNPVGTFVTGTIHGSLMALGRTAVGLIEVGTFFIPLPTDYREIMPAPGYFDRGH